MKRDWKSISWPTYLLVCLFGIGSWIAVNGIWVELPLLVNHAPEKWSLPSYLAVITQLANVGPVIYSAGNYLAPKKVHEKPVILLITTTGAISCAMLAVFWDAKSKIEGVEHSVALFVLTFTLALVDCTSSVVFLTFMALFPTSYISALFVGETFSGMLPAFVALSQGIGKEKACQNGSLNTNHSRSNMGIEGANGTRTMWSTPNFGPDVFFFFLCGMMLVCSFSFLGLNYLPVAKKQHVKIRSASGKNIEEGEQPLIDGDTISARDSKSYNSIDTPPTLQFSATSNKSNNVSRCTIRHIVYLLVIQAWINCLSNGVLTSIQSYATAPYGNMTYHLVATLTSIASALTCFLALWFPSRSLVLITINTVVYTLLSGYVLALAVLSPAPPLHNSLNGRVIIVLVSIVSGCLVSYTKLTICSVMREKGQRALFWCGISIQLGSFIGAIVMFPLVNVLKLFHGAKQC